jgi:tetratricopeptide (TPR) repeat protein/predicted Ser/Thr protein kinase
MLPVGGMAENRAPEGVEASNSTDETLAGRDAPTLVGDERPPAREQGGRLTKGASIGRYVVLDSLGAGGMGVVYAAFDPQLDRRVALKVLRPDPDGSSGSSWGGPERLLREAQAMARLSHPNVIAVHDVGTHEDEVFVAMELVDGETLKDWRAHGSRTWQEVLDVFRQAGAGLAAAHRAGIVHRDFKPDNVMISRDGRVYVLDFGLARPHAGGRPEQESLPSSETHRTEGDESGPSISVDTRLTQTGALLGTPAYMAPEQHRGEEASAAADQFAFCVALYEALYDQRPFAGETTASLAFNVLQGKVREPPSEARVPRRVRAALLRGLEADARKRWPSMDALLRELARDPAKNRRLAAGVGALLLVAAGAYAWGSRDVAPTACGSSEERLVGVWDDAAREAGEAAFAATQKPYAAQAWDRTRAELDAYAEAWQLSHADACEATHVRGEQSARMLDLRMICLEQRRRQLDAAADLFADADEDVLQRAHRITAGLPPLAPCSDLGQLDAGADPPPAPLRDAVEQARTTLARVAVMVDAGQYEDALAKVRPVVEAADETGYGPLQAEAKFWLGYLLEKTGDPEAAVEPLSQAAFDGQASRHDAIAARAMTVLVFVTGDRLAHIDEALDWARHARAAVSRLDDPLAEAELLNDEGIALITAGRYPEAEERLKQALALREEQLGATHFQVGRTLNNLATAIENQGRFDEARAHYERALELARESMGPDHPDVGVRLTNLGELLARMGELETARRYQEQARSVFASSVGEQHHYYASATNNLAMVDVQEGKLEDAMKLMIEAKSIWANQLGPDHPEIALTELNIGSIAYQLKMHDEAMVHLEVARSIYTRAFGEDHPDLASVLIVLGDLSGDTGDTSTAEAHYRRAIEILTKHAGPDHPEIASASKHLGLLLVRLDRGPEAIDPLENALRIESQHSASAQSLADLRFDLARARWAADQDRARARVLMTEAAAGFREAGSDDDRADAEAWLAEHG